MDWNLGIKRSDRLTAAVSAETTAAPNADELGKKLANPLAAMISVPFQNNFDWGQGPGGDGFQWKMNVQPVMPFTRKVKKLSRAKKRWYFSPRRRP